MKIYKLSGFAIAAVLSAIIAHAQDTRHVTEPVIPPSCVVLKSQLHADKGVFANGDADETKLDTARIQNAMDKCTKKGKAVELAPSGANNAFLAGPLELREGVILHIDKGVTLYASRDPKLYETSADSCGKLGDVRGGCKSFIVANNANNSGIEGDGVVDGRGGSKIIGKTMSWWEVAATSPGGKTPQEVPQLITTDHADNFTLYKITIKDAAHFHFVPTNSDGITAWGLKIDTPDHTANTDGFDPSGGTKNITLIYSYIRDGDDNVAIKGGPGGVNNISVLHDHFYYGHGMSIGSGTDGGVSHLLVRDLSLDGTDNGIRIKSNPTRGGLVDGALYDDVCIRNVRYPIFLTASYSWPGGQQGLLPVYKNIVLHNVRIAGGGKLQIDGLDATHRIGVQFDGVVLDDPSKFTLTTFKHADVILGPGPTNLPLTGGEDSTITGTPGKGKLAECEAKFVPFPHID